MLNNFKRTFIGTRAFYRALIALVIPIMIQQGITSFVSLLDNIMVGRLGTESLSAVAIVNQLFMVFNLTIFGGVSGASIFGAQFHGKGDHEGVRAAFRFKLILGVVMSVACIIALIFCGDALISLFLTESESSGNLVLTLEEAHKYMLVMLIGLVPFAITQSYSSTLRETGETVSPMVASVIALLVNLVLNYVFIFGHFGVPAMGVTGAAAATVIARYIEMLFLIVHTYRQREHFTFINGAFRTMRIPMVIVRKILITGTPLMLNETFWSLGMTMINQSYSTRGLAVVAATNINGTVWNLFTIIMMAMGSATSILIGQQLGAGKIEEAKQTSNRLLFFTVALHVGIGMLLAISSPFIPLIYNTEPEVRALATQLMLVAAVVLPIVSFVHVTYFTIRSGGKTGITFLFDSVYTWLVPVPLSFVLSRFTALPMVWVYFCVQIIEIIKALIGVCLLRSGVWANNIINDTHIAEEGSNNNGIE